MTTAMRKRCWVRGEPLRASDFPAGTALNHFFTWNARARRRDRRYIIACDLYRLMTALGNGREARSAAVAHLASGEVIVVRGREGRLLINQVWPIEANTSEPAVIAARQTVERLTASMGSAKIDDHAAMFAAFEQLADEIDLDALARRRPLCKPSTRRHSPRRILVIRLSALGDFVQALGPVAAMRQYHRDDHITLLTTAALAKFAQQLGFFDDVVVDHRPAPFDIVGWLALRRALRHGRFDRVYDLQTSERSGVYARLFGPGPIAEWSGIVGGCSHPHANLDRDRQHTIDKQAEQLLMAGVYPTPLPTLPPLDGAFPREVVGRPFVLMVPGSSPRHPAKRWPAERYGLLARELRIAGCASAVIGSSAERPLGAAIRDVCSEVIDLIGRTDLESVAALAQRAVLTIGNDTGVTHLAAAANCPVVVLFSGASDPAWCAPRGRIVRVLARPNLAELDVDQVLAEAIKIIKGCERSTKAKLRPQVTDAARASEAWS